VPLVLGDEVQSVFARTGTFHAREWQVEDCALMNLRFRSGAIASVDPSWSIPENNPYHYDFYLRILTENGTIDLDDTRQALTVVSDRPGERPVNSEPFGLDIDLEMIRHFVGCAAEGQNQFPAATGEDGLRALEIALSAYDSARVGQPVDLKLHVEKDR
jgi:predicted dehydrogenase